MKVFSLILTFFLSITSFAEVMNAHPKLLEEARSQKLISVQTLIVKLKKNADFLIRKKWLGNFKSFFKASDGEWGYLELSLLPDSVNANLILSDLEKDQDILYAYYAPFAINADQVLENKSHTRSIRETYVETPDFEKLQTYLENPPLGIGAKAAWKYPGGRGENVKIVDIETCFEDKHEDFLPPFFNGNNPQCESPDHGTSVWGIIAAKNDGKGVTGIAHEAEFGIFGIIEGSWSEVNDQYIASINNAISEAINHLDQGDVLVIEQQMIGPDFKRPVAIEYWPHIYEQLKAATEKGIICVEAAGNGNSNLDSVFYQNAFNLSFRDSGCILVGAINNDFERGKWKYSNFGSRIDASAFGEKVVSAGYGDLFNGGLQKKYTKNFSGTSSATPIVAGAVAIVSSMAKEMRRDISPRKIRQALRGSVMPQAIDNFIKPVGNYPNIEQLLLNLDLN